MLGGGTFRGVRAPGWDGKVVQKEREAQIPMVKCTWEKRTMGDRGKGSFQET